MRAAYELSKPVLGICRGLQEMNVALGGTLRGGFGAGDRDLSHHAPASVEGMAIFDWSHDVQFEPGGRLERAAGASRARVNSVHFQCIDQLADQLRIEAVAPDGAIEAVSARDRPLLAVQWHPEAQIEDPVSAAVFKAFRSLMSDAA